ncbi:MAG: nucleotidyltransferase family protein [Candidatus Dojkabacteria bacterium]
MEIPRDRIDQEKLISEILLSSVEIRRVLKALNSLNLPQPYLGAGCIPQTIWNHLTSRIPAEGIKDFDIIYYDDSDLSEEKEKEIGSKLKELLPGLNIDAKNKARVHLWYKSKFGEDIPQYQSSEDAIDTWPTTATAIGVRLKNDNLEIYAPFGLEDLLSMTLRANQTLITKDVYQKKVERYSKEWPELYAMDWID